ncbi:LOW QUALITY PROTEIN: cilia- and flagella-associated protein 53-like [Pelodytes ibericus]
MPLSQRTRPRYREVTGPTHHSVATQSKYSSRRPMDFLVFENQRQDEIRYRLLSFTKEDKSEYAKHKWERMTDYKIMHNTVQRRVSETMEAYETHLEERRERLKALLESEAMENIKRMEAMKETPLERQARIRARTRCLKAKTERERQAIVTEKLEQQFREHCEELRNMKSKMKLNEVCKERMAQLGLKDQLNRQRQEKEKLFAEIWEKDWIAKEESNEKHAKQKYNVCEKIYLNIQLACSKFAPCIQAHKMEGKRLNEEEAQLLEEERRLMKMEDERALREKRQKQSQVRSMLDKSIHMKMKRISLDQQDELALDMKIVDQIMQDPRDDSKEKHQRKVGPTDAGPKRAILDWSCLPPIEQGLRSESTKDVLHIYKIRLQAVGRRLEQQCSQKSLAASVQELQGVPGVTVSIVSRPHYKDAPMAMDFLRPGVLGEFQRVRILESVSEIYPSPVSIHMAWKNCRLEEIPNSFQSPISVSRPNQWLRQGEVVECPDPVRLLEKFQEAQEKTNLVLRDEEETDVQESRRNCMRMLMIQITNWIQKRQRHSPNVKAGQKSRSNAADGKYYYSIKLFCIRLTTLVSNQFASHHNKNSSLLKNMGIEKITNYWTDGEKMQTLGKTEVKWIFNIDTDS